MKCFHFPGAGGQRQYGSSTTARLISVRSRGTAGIESRRSQAYGPDSSPAVWGPPEGLRAFSFSELRAATRGFSRALMIGEGGFGCVYRGVVRGSGDGAAAAVDVAVKQMSRSGLQGHKEWITEVNILGVVKHPNLVKLVGYCAEDDERGIQRLLVYEFMPNKSLEDHLLARISSNLSWTLRLKIACDAARGLAYLHEEMDFQLIFRDFKTSNVLLDEDFNAKLSDFGFARHGPAMGVGHISTSVVGTVGYAAPEYVHSGRLTTKSDVWSFGVVLYELITGRRSIDRNLPRTEQSLLEWVRPYATDPKKLHRIIDPRLEGECCKRSVRKLVALANKCLMKQPKLRPKMSQVVEMLDEIIGMSSGTGSETSIPDDSFEGTEIQKERVACKSKVFDFREVINLRNRSVGRLERLLGPGSIGKLARTWGYD